jgi:hypothetical protein
MKPRTLIAHRAPTWRWRIVRVFRKCAFGCRISSGQMAAFGPHRFVLCEPCAKKHYGLEPSDDERPQWKGLAGRDKQLPENER